MKIQIFSLLAVPIFTLAATGQATKSATTPQSRPTPSLASIVTTRSALSKKKLWKLLKPCRKINSISHLRG